MTMLRAPHACCRDPRNRGPDEVGGRRLTFQRCQVCGRRHFTLSIPPARVGMQVRRAPDAGH